MRVRSTEICTPRQGKPGRRRKGSSRPTNNRRRRSLELYKYGLGMARQADWQAGQPEQQAVGLWHRTNRDYITDIVDGSRRDAKI